MKEKSNEKRMVLITGGSRGIGRAAALAFAEKGFNVAINYAGNQEAAEKTLKDIKTLGAEGIAIQGDVGSEEDSRKIVDQTISTFGKIDVLVNSAGITRDNLLPLMKPEEFDEVIRTNLKGTWNMMKAVIRPMMKKRYGRIVNLASVVGISGNAGQVNYAASKAGVIGMTKSLAKEMASRNITVNAVAPGYVETDMTAGLSDSARDAMNQAIPCGRPGKPSEIAEAICFLAGEKAGYITGQVLCVDGGMCM